LAYLGSVFPENKTKGCICWWQMKSFESQKKTVSISLRTSLF
jgi:hypothetical protein